MMQNPSQLENGSGTCKQHDFAGPALWSLCGGASAVGTVVHTSFVQLHSATFTASVQKGGQLLLNCVEFATQLLLTSS